MTQVSYPWDGVTVGDAIIALYSSQEFARDWFQLAFVYDRTQEGVIDTGMAGYTGGLVVAAGAGVVTVQTGAAIVDGRVFKSNAVETLTPDDTPSSRVDRVVLRCDQSAQTVRLVILKGTDGVGTPTALTQNTAAGGTWEISLAKFAVTPGPVIGTVTAEARAIRSPLGPGYQAATFTGVSDISWGAGSYQDIDTGVSMYCGPGKWLISGGVLAQADAGNPRARIYDNTGGSAVAHGYAEIRANGEVVTIYIPPRIVNLSVTTQFRLQYYPVNAANDIVYGDGGGQFGTGMVAIRVI